MSINIKSLVTKSSSRKYKAHSQPENRVRPLQQDADNKKSILLVTHNRYGGVYKYVRDKAQELEAKGYNVLILKPNQPANVDFIGQIVTVSSGGSTSSVFNLPNEADRLMIFLKEKKFSNIEFHHFIGYNDCIFELVASLAAPYDVYIHDYSWFCPRITLTNGKNQYCGEPKINDCIKCIKSLGGNIDDDIPLLELRKRSKKFLEEASQVIVPSEDVKKRFKRQLDISAVIKPWEIDQPLQLKYPDTAGQIKRRICIVGAIGYEKGYDVILRLAQLIRHNNIPLELVIVGYTCDDQRLLHTGQVKITGKYRDSEVREIIIKQKAAVGFLPSIWPETWSYSLSEMWAAGLPVVAFDIGTPADRIRNNNGGLVVPIHTPLEKLLSVFDFCYQALAKHKTT